MVAAQRVPENHPSGALSRVHSGVPAPEDDATWAARNDRSRERALMEAGRAERRSGSLQSTRSHKLPTTSGSREGCLRCRRVLGTLEPTDRTERNRLS
jgi:hypothetical protein